MAEHRSTFFCSCPNCEIKTHDNIHICEGDCEEHGPFPTRWKYYRVLDQWNFGTKKQEIIVSFLRSCRPYSLEERKIYLEIDEPNTAVTFSKSIE